MPAMGGGRHTGPASPLVKTAGVILGAIYFLFVLNSQLLTKVNNGTYFLIGLAVISALLIFYAYKKYSEWYKEWLNDASTRPQNSLKETLVALGTIFKWIFFILFLVTFSQGFFIYSAFFLLGSVVVLLISMFYPTYFARASPTDYPDRFRT